MAGKCGLAMSAKRSVDTGIMTDLSALPGGTELAGDYKIERVLGAGGFGVTYLADEKALSRKVSIKEYFPSDFAFRSRDGSATPRSENCKGDYTWGLERFVEEAQTLAKFDHPNIVRVFRTFQANNTAYMVLNFEEGQSLKSWLKGLKRAPRQKELDAIIGPLLDAMTTIHKAEFLHRDIAPDNIIIRSSGEPVLIDFGAARSDIAAHSKTKTVSALVKPGYSPYEQYAETSKQQGPWSDIYAFAATLYHAVTGKRPPDSPSRMLKDEMIATPDAALSSYRPTFLDAIQKGLALRIEDRPQSVEEWRIALLAPSPPAAKQGMIARLRERTEVRRGSAKTVPVAGVAAPQHTVPPPDMPGPQGGILDFVDQLKAPKADAKVAQAAAAKPPEKAPAPKKSLFRAAPEAPVNKAKAEIAKPADDAKVKAAPARRQRETVAKRKARPAPAVPRRRSLSREIKTKVMVALAMTLAGFIFKDQIVRLAQPVPTAITTGAIATPSEDRKISQASAFEAHNGTIDAVAYSGNGHLIVTSGSDRTLKVWDAETQNLKGATTLEGGSATALNVRNNRVVIGHADGTVAVYDLDTLNRLYAFKRSDASIWAAVFAGSEDVIAAAGGDPTIALWQTGSTTAPSAFLDGHRGTVSVLASDPTGRWLASGGDDHQVKLWSLERQRLRRTLRGGMPNAISALAFSSNGGMLAAGSSDGALRLWSANTGRNLRRLSGHSARITSIAFSSRGDLIASADEAGAVRVRGLKRGGIYGALNDLGPGASALAFSTDGATLATGGRDGKVRLWPIPQPVIAQGN